MTQKSNIYKLQKQVYNPPMMNFWFTSFDFTFFALKKSE